MKVGELARLTGISVRTLHYYGEIGLLPPPLRNEAGHRLYGAKQIARLQQIRSLRQLGFTMKEVRAFLKSRSFSPHRVIEMQLKRVNEQIVELRRLTERLECLGEAIRSKEVSVDQFIKTIEAMNMAERIYTKEQAEELHDRRRQLGSEGMRKFEQDWTALIAEIGVEMDKGTNPRSERPRVLAERWDALVKLFTGGNPEIEETLYAGARRFQLQQKEKGTPIPDVVGYMIQAMRR